MRVNSWANEFLPNCSSDFSRSSFTTKVVATTQALLEFPLRGKIGDHVERLEMTRKIARFAKQEGFGDETVFNAEVCQGNFHHHRQWTRESFEKKLADIASQLSEEVLEVRI